MVDRKRRRLVRGEPVTAKTEIVHKHRGEVVARREIDRAGDAKVKVPEAFARVGVRGSSTVNVGDFNSVQVSVWVELPCAPTDEALARTYKRGSDMVEAWIQEQLDAALPNDEDAI